MLINWNNYKEVGTGNVDYFWPDRDKPLEVGDCIEGMLTQKTSRAEEHSASYVLETNEGIALVWGSTVLDRKLQDIALGSKIAIEYLGDKASEKRKGKKYKDFKVGVIIPAP